MSSPSLRRRGGTAWAKFAALPSLILVLAIVLATSPTSTEAIFIEFFRDVGRGINDFLIGVKRAVGLNELADRLERRKYRRGKGRRRRRYRKKGKRSAEEEETIDLIEEYHVKVRQALEAATIADYGDCAKKMFCDVAFKDHRLVDDEGAGLSATEVSILKLFPADDSPTDGRFSSDSAAQLDIAVAVGRGTIGGDPNASPCAAVYARCPKETAELVELLDNIETVGNTVVEEAETALEEE